MIKKEEFLKLMEDYNCNKKQLAKYLHITEKTLNNKINGITEFTLSEIQLLWLMFPKNEVERIIKI